jgi:hypothetical protein
VIALWVVGTHPTLTTRAPPPPRPSPHHSPPLDNTSICSRVNVWWRVVHRQGAGVSNIVADTSVRDGSSPKNKARSPKRAGAGAGAGSGTSRSPVVDEEDDDARRWVCA